MTHEETHRVSLKAPSPADLVLDFWFGELDASGNSDGDHRKHWWSKDAAFDAEIRERFGALFALLLSPDLPRPAWQQGPRGLLAAVIVLDQFSRNMFRDTPAMYAGDTRARLLAFEILALGYEKKLPLALRTFSYMPLMHSERLEDQERCVELFEELASLLTGDEKKNALGNARYAISHRDIVARFGRFPHRNKILGRASTPEEVEFLKEPGSSF